MLCGHAARAWASNLPWIALSGQAGMLPLTYLTFGSSVNTVVFGDCVVAGLSIVVLMMLCSETPPKTFLSCLVGESVVCNVWPVTAAFATPERARAPITPTKAPIRYLRLRIPLLFRWAISLTAPDDRTASPWICLLSLNLTQQNGLSCAARAHEIALPSIRLPPLRSCLRAYGLA